MVAACSKDKAPLACMAVIQREMDIAEKMGTYVDEFRRGLAVRHGLRHDDCLAESESERVLAGCWRVEVLIEKRNDV